MIMPLAKSKCSKTDEGTCSSTFMGISLTPSYKYLGINLEYTGNTSEFVQTIHAKITKAAWRIHFASGMAKLSVRHRLLIVQTYLLSKINYHLIYVKQLNYVSQNAIYAQYNQVIRNALHLPRKTNLNMMYTILNILRPQDLALYQWMRCYFKVIELGHGFP